MVANEEDRFLTPAHDSVMRLSQGLPRAVAFRGRAGG